MADPLRHYYAPRDGREGNTCAHGTAAGHSCARPESDPVHLPPGDTAAWDEAVKASTVGHNARNPDPAIRDTATKRHAARWTLGTGTAPTSARGPSVGG